MAFDFFNIKTEIVRELCNEKKLNMNNINYIAKYIEFLEVAVEKDGVKYNVAAYGNNGKTGEYFEDGLTVQEHVEYNIKLLSNINFIPKHSDLYNEFEEDNLNKGQRQKAIYFNLPALEIQLIKTLKLIRELHDGINTLHRLQAKENEND